MSTDNPNDAEALNRQALLAHQRGEIAVALKLYQRAIALRPDAAGYHNNLGVSLHALGRIGEAADAYRRAASLNPKAAQIQFNLGNTLHELGKADDAIVALREAIRLRPGVAEFHYCLGRTLTAAAQSTEAADAYRAAVEIKPDYVDAWMNLGNVLQALGRTDSALVAHRKAVALRPDYAEAHNNLGMSLFTAGDFERSIAEFRKAGSLRPDFASAWSNLGNVLREVGLVDEAVAAYRRAISVEVDHADARKNLSLTLLLLGDYADGFLEYEWRWKVADAQPRRFNRPKWTGEDPSGKMIFVYEEQGYGDIIQFVRYAQVLHNRGATVIVGCRPELVRLLSGCAGITQVVTGGQSILPFDLHCPLLSLPLFCRTTTMAEVPAQVPYIRVADDIAQVWKDRLPAIGRPRVGLCWAGNPENRTDRFRSIALEKFLPLVSAGDIEFHSLQVGPAALQRTQVSGLALQDHGADLHDFADTAALIDRFDLVISVETAVAHLAGALGKPVWILIPAAPDWRWLLKRADSPWYPTARLFRRRGDWDEVIREMAAYLAKWLAR